tara:strand:- start:4019 stop:4282 length:264 start_codon:yes stop_codon:yes gene_type:complete
MRDFSKKERQAIANLLEEDPAFLDFVINSTTSGVWVGDLNSKNFMKTLLAEDQQAFVASLCHIGFVVYTDYLMSEREYYLAQSKALH